MKYRAPQRKDKLEIRISYRGRKTIGIDSMTKANTLLGGLFHISRVPLDVSRIFPGIQISEPSIKSISAYYNR